MTRVRNFDYDGFGGQLLEGDAPYTAELIEWTLDPGVGRFRCSDGKERLIPTFALPADHSEWEKPASAPSDYSPLCFIGAPSKS